MSGVLNGESLTSNMPGAIGGQFRSHGAEGHHRFFDPFLLPSSSGMPLDLPTIMDLACYLYHCNPQFMQAAHRVVSYFVTDFEISSEDKSSGQESEDELTKALNNMLLKESLIDVGDDAFCYGNTFVRMHLPFDRYLKDTRDGQYTEYAVSAFGPENVKYDSKTLKYEVPDPRQKRTPIRSRRKISLPFIDKKVSDSKRCRLIKLDPRRIRIKWGHQSGSERIIYMFEPWFKTHIETNILHQINETPRGMLEAISQGKDFEFHEGEVHHLKFPCVSGISVANWGLPPALSNYRSLHQIQIYRKIDECVGLDYLLPFRVFTPPDNENAKTLINNQQWKSGVAQMIRERRRNPFAMHMLPYMVQYSEFGASGKNLTPKDLLEFETNNMLDGAGFPAELFRGSLKAEQIPPNIRLFENSFWFLFSGLNRLTGWAADKLIKYLQFKPKTVGLQRPKFADDIDRQNVLLQLGVSGEISRRTAWTGLHLGDAVGEATRRMEEDLQIEEARQKKTDEVQRRISQGTLPEAMAALVQGQGGPGGAGPAGPGPGGPGGDPSGGDPSAGAMPGPVAGGIITPQKLEQTAQDEAQTMLSMPEGPRRKRLDALRGSNPTLHKLVLQDMEEARNSGASQGRAQVSNPAPQ